MAGVSHIKLKGMKPSSETNLRGISKDAPGWFHVENSRINEKTSKGHRLRENGRKEQAMSNSVPDFFVGERVSLEEMNKGRGRMLKGRRQNSVMKSKIYEKKGFAKKPWKEVFAYRIKQKFTK